MTVWLCLCLLRGETISGDVWGAIDVNALNSDFEACSWFYIRYRLAFCLFISTTVMVEQSQNLAEEDILLGESVMTEQSPNLVEEDILLGDTDDSSSIDLPLTRLPRTVLGLVFAIIRLFVAAKNRQTALQFVSRWRKQQSN